MMMNLKSLSCVFLLALVVLMSGIGLMSDARIICMTICLIMKKYNYAQFYL